MIRKYLPHLNIIFVLIMTILFVANKINAGLGVLRGKTFETLLLIFIIVSFSNSTTLFFINNRSKH